MLVDLQSEKLASEKRFFFVYFRIVTRSRSAKRQAENDPPNEAHKNPEIGIEFNGLKQIHTGNDGGISTV